MAQKSREGQDPQRVVQLFFYGYFDKCNVVSSINKNLDRYRHKDYIGLRTD